MGQRVFGQIADAKFQTGLALCRNAVILPHGPVAKRAGFGYVNTALTGSQRQTAVYVVAAALLGYATWMFLGAVRGSSSHDNGKRRKEEVSR